MQDGRTEGRAAVSAERLLRRGESREAARLLQRRLAQRPDDLAAARRLAWILGEDGRDAEYLRLFEDHAAHWARDPYLLLNAAQAWARLGRLETARQAYRRLARDPAAAAYRAAVEEGLRFLAREAAAAASVRGALRRARVLGIGSAILFGATALVLWLRLRPSRRDP